MVGGRVNTLGLDGLVAYDVMGSAYAFSPFGLFRLLRRLRRHRDQPLQHGDQIQLELPESPEFMNFHVAGLVQIGSYNQGNASTQLWQGDIGADFPNLFAGNYFAGTFSFDAIGGYAENA